MQDKYLIAIHHDPRGFSQDWIDYCNENDIRYKLVNCYSNDIIEDLKECSALMWNWYHDDYKAQLFARQLTLSLESRGMICFPDTKTCWHYDDKLGQKYLFESIGIDTPKSYAFYSKCDALANIGHLSFPIVFKTRGGAGSSNVELIYTKGKLKSLINQAFGKGFKPINRISFFKDALTGFIRKPDYGSLMSVLRATYRVFLRSNFEKMHSIQKGYIYLQEFIPRNESDTRVIIIDNKAFAIKRLCRKGDFRASGSGSIIYDKSEIDIRCIETAFKAYNALEVNCIAFDFVFDDNGNCKIIEISYAYSHEAYRKCEGYWSEKLVWQPGPFNPQSWMVKSIVNRL